MAETLTVTIQGKDGVSKTFTAIAQSATKAGDAVEQAGKDGARELKNLDTAAKTTGKSMDDLERRATAVGAAVGVLGTALIGLGQNNRDAERQISGITALYGENADAILEMSEGIQDYTRYSNDAARESALLSSSLVSAYGLSTDQLSVLIERSADLAQVYGFTLPDAVQRTSSAIRGEGESAERLGLNLSDAAIAARALDAGITNWNVPGALSEAEKAAFRFEVFMADTESTVGRAADAADNAGGRFREFANNLDDAAERAGELLGPVGDVAAELAPVAIALPIVGAGIGKVGTAFAGTAVGARAASLGVAALGLAFNPLTLTIGAVVAGGALLAKGWLDQRQAADDYRASISSLEVTLEMLRRQGDDALADLAEGTSNAVDQIVTMQRTIDTVMYTPGSEQAQAVEEQARAIDQLSASAGLAEAAQNKLNEALNDPNVDADRFLEWADGLVQLALKTPEATDDLAALQAIADVALSDFSRHTDEATAGLGQFSGAANAAGQAMYGQITAQKVNNQQYAELLENVQRLEEANVSFLSNGDNVLDFWLKYRDVAMQGGAAGAQAMETVNAAADFQSLVGLADDLGDAGAALDRVLTVYSQIDALGARSASAGSIADTLIGSIDDNLAGAEAAIGTLESLWQRVTAGTAESYLTQVQYNDALTAAGSIQQSNLRVQDDLTAMRAQQLPLLAQEQAAYESQIDLISQLPALEQRRALALQDSAVQAQLATQHATAYSASVGEIPEEVATQMIVSSAEADPVIKDLLLNMGLIEEGADGEIRVNFPDGDTVQESILMLTNSVDALIVTLGGIPPVRLTAEDEATPVVNTLIDVLGQTDGMSATATVTATDNASGTVRDAQGVIRSTDSVVGTGRVTAIDTASGTTRDAQGVIRSLTGKSVTLTAIDNASGPANAAQRAINALSSRSVTLTTYYKTVGSPPAGMIGPTREAHGGIAGYALGGNVVPIWAGEAGPEIEHFAGGGSTLIPREGLHMARQGSYIEPANSARSSVGGSPIIVHVHVAGNLTTERQLIASAAEAIWTAEINDRRRRDVALGLAS